MQGSTPEPPDARHTPPADARSIPASPEIRFYDNEVPPFVEAELERLYECLMSTLARFDIFEAAPNASTYTVHENGQITTLFLFRRERHHVTVYNEQMPLAAADIRRFADAVFARYPSVRLISFYAIATDAPAIGYPFQRRECLEDIHMTLPASADAYLSRLGANTRAGLRRAQRQLQRDHPSFRFEVYEQGAASASDVHRLVAFNQARMSEKGQVSSFTAPSTEQLVRLVQKYGVLGVAIIDGLVCGGTISLRVGARYFMHVLAHDSRYNAYQLGKLCCYFSIRDAIERGCKEYNFGWGRYDYKFKLLGQLTQLDRVEIYRSRLHMVWHSRRLAHVAFRSDIRKLKRRIARAEAGARFSDRCIARAAILARAARRLLRRVRGP